MSLVPAESFPALEALPGIRATFLQRAPHVDVRTDRDTAMARLQAWHRQQADTLGFAGQPFATAEQVHGQRVARVDTVATGPVPAADALISASRNICLAIYVADCAAVYFADRKYRAIGLAHSGKKGTELGIVPQTISALEENYAIPPADLILQIAPCIRPPHYEIDFAAEIVRQAQAAGVQEVHDCGTCTAAHPERYYSYRREKGQTGRLLALMAFAHRSRS